MSLNWNAVDAPLWDKNASEWREAIIWATMEVRISCITEKNWQEFASRWYTINGLAAPHVGGERSLMAMIRAVRNSIGLRTNADDYTKTKFSNLIQRLAAKEVEMALLREAGQRLDELVDR